MSYTEHQYDALIEEKKKEVEYYEKLNNIPNVERKAVGWLTIFLLVLTASFGGMSSGGDGLVGGLLTIGAFIYYFKLISDDKKIAENLLVCKEQLDELYRLRNEA